MIRNLNKHRGHLITSQRKLILDILKEADGHLDAKELYRKASERDPNISMATVYRTLRLFYEMGLIDERRLGQVRCSYELKRQADHHHLICKGCGRIMEVDSPLIRKLIKELQNKNKFHVIKAELCFEGYCVECEENQQ
jgi:Fur family ferric uptake transcriptional regulator